MQEGQSESRGEEGSGRGGRACCSRREAQPRSTGLQKPKVPCGFRGGVAPSTHFSDPTSLISRARAHEMNFVLLGATELSLR